MVAFTAIAFGDKLAINVNGLLRAMVWSPRPDGGSRRLNRGSRPTQRGSPSGQIRVPLGGLTKIERRELSGFMTTFLAVTVAVGIYVAVEALAEAAVTSKL